MGVVVWMRTRKWLVVGWHCYCDCNQVFEDTSTELKRRNVQTKEDLCMIENLKSEVKVLAAKAKHSNKVL